MPKIPPESYRMVMKLCLANKVPFLAVVRNNASALHVLSFDTKIILVPDESTTILDTESKQIVQEASEKPAKGRRRASSRWLRSFTDGRVWDQYWLPYSGCASFKTVGCYYSRYSEAFTITCWATGKAVLKTWRLSIPTSNWKKP